MKTKSIYLTSSFFQRFFNPQKISFKQLLNISQLKIFSIIILFQLSSIFVNAQDVETIPIDTTILNISPNNDCNDLFISEIALVKVPNGSGGYYFDYAVEVYNASPNTIALNNYSLELVSQTNTTVNIPLTTSSVNSHDVFLVSSTNAELQLSSISDLLSADLNLGSYITLNLKKNGVVIDQVGESSYNSQPFNYSVFFNDPVGYLNTYDLNLDDYQNLILRRSEYIKQGKPNFQTIDLNSDWRIDWNGDLSKLGSHIGPCDPLGYNSISFHDNFQQIIKCFQNGASNPYTVRRVWPLLDMYLTCPTGCDFQISYHMVNNANYPSTCYPVINDEGISHSYDIYSSTFNAYWDYINGLYTNVNGTSIEQHSYRSGSGVLTQQPGQFGIGAYNNNLPDCMYSLQIYNGFGNSSATTFSDGSTTQVYVKYVNCFGFATNVIEENFKNSTTIIPTITHDYIEINAFDKCNYEIISNDGRVVKSGEIDTYNNKVDISNLASSNYFVKISYKSTNFTKQITKL